jgi:hypothetical protein
MDLKGQSLIAKIAQERIREADAPMGYLTDNHLRWIKGYVYWKFNTKVVSFYVDFDSRPRRLYIVPSLPDGKMISRYQWLKMMWSLWKIKNPNKPLLHPMFWPAAIDLIEWKIIFSRTPVKGLKRE